jgi:hypothetical protein
VKPGPGGPGFVADPQKGGSASVISGGSQTTKLSEMPSRCQVSIMADRVAAAGEPVVVDVVVDVRDDGAVAHLGHG